MGESKRVFLRFANCNSSRKIELRCLDGRVSESSFPANEVATRSEATEDLDRMPRPADGAFDSDFTRLRIERFEDRIQQDRPMFAERRAAAARTHVPPHFFCKPFWRAMIASAACCLV